MTGLRATDVAPVTTPPGSTCRTCGYVLDHRVIEEEWQPLERCPSCGAYYWTPEPIKIRERATFEEGEPETLTDPYEPVSPELRDALAERGIPLPDWQPKIERRQ